MRLTNKIFIAVNILLSSEAPQAVHITTSPMARLAGSSVAQVRAAGLSHRHSSPASAAGLAEPHTVVTPEWVAEGLSSSTSTTLAFGKRRLSLFLSAEG